MELLHSPADEDHPLTGPIIEEFRIRQQPQHFPHGDPYYGALNEAAARVITSDCKFAGAVEAALSLEEETEGRAPPPSLFVNKFERVVDKLESTDPLFEGYEGSHDNPLPWAERMRKIGDNDAEFATDM